MNYQKINNIAGWLMFVLATAVYMLTAEPTGSFWDCGEFISCAYKLQVAHSPGAPLFIMMAHMFTLLAPDHAHIALMVNFYSAIMGGLTVLFVFWTITALAKKILVEKGKEISNEIKFVIMGAGIIGGLACTFADSIWFSAVEGEVYSSSSFFTAIVFWAVLKWDEHADEKYADRWLILIAYLMGLSTGVHLLCLLAIPAIVFMYYFRRFESTGKGIFYTFLISIGILGFIQYFVIQGLPFIASRIDLKFVNDFHMPFFSGALFFAILIIVGVAFGLNWAKKKNNYIVHMSLLCFSVIVIGYLSYAQVVVRAGANPSINMSNPKDLMNLQGYLSREQYGDRPLLFGQKFTDRPIAYDSGTMKYRMNERTGRYDAIGKTQGLKYEDGSAVFFPRMYDSDDALGHVRVYKEFCNLADGEAPDFSDNMKFFIGYQCNWMYWRYMLWNFVGRQNDLEGNQRSGQVSDGNWLSGINFIDNIRLGDQSNLPAYLRDNKARNKFYFLPLILGVLGMYFHFRRKKHDAWVVLIFFFFTGLAIVLYLNQVPNQPRERDYAYAGSVYAFTIWIGLGMLAIYDFLKSRTKQPMNAVFGAFGLALIAPLLMGMNGWDDHNRSNRYTARDMGKDYLESCAPNAILFTQGDNDTYPLWYAQETEGIRRDVRIVNLSLAGVDWYIEGLHRKVNESDIVPTILSDTDYIGDMRNQIYFNEDNDLGLDKGAFMEAKNVMRFIGSNNPKDKMKMIQGEPPMNYFPTKNFFVSVNKNEVIANHVVADGDTGKIQPRIQFTINRGYLTKAEITILDIIAANQWNRPIYWAVSCSPGNYLGLANYLVQEGLAYRLTPVLHEPDQRKPRGYPGGVNTKIMYENLMNKYSYGNVDKAKSIYLDNNIMGMMWNLQYNFTVLANALIDEGKPGDSVLVDQSKLDLAIKVLDKAQEFFPQRNLPLNLQAISLVSAYYRAGARDKAKVLMNQLYDMSYERLTYYASLPDDKRMDYANDADDCERMFQQGAYFAHIDNDTVTLKKFSQAAQTFAAFELKN